MPFRRGSKQDSKMYVPGETLQENGRQSRGGRVKRGRKKGTEGVDPKGGGGMKIEGRKP